MQRSKTHTKRRTKRTCISVVLSIAMASTLMVPIVAWGESAQNQEDEQTIVSGGGSTNSLNKEATSESSGQDSTPSLNDIPSARADSAVTDANDQALASRSNTLNISRVAPVPRTSNSVETVGPLHIYYALDSGEEREMTSFTQDYATYLEALRLDPTSFNTLHLRIVPADGFSFEAGAGNKITSLSVGWQSTTLDGITIASEIALQTQGDGSRTCSIPSNLLKTMREDTYDYFAVNWQSDASFPNAFGTYRGVGLVASADYPTFDFASLVGTYRDSNEKSIVLSSDGTTHTGAIADEVDSQGNAASKSVNQVVYSYDPQGALLSTAVVVGSNVNAYLAIGTDDEGDRTLTALDDYTYRTLAGDNTGHIAKGSVFASKPVASIGSNSYFSLEEAVANAQNGDKITLLMDTTLANKIVLNVTGRSVTLDLNGHTVNFGDYYISTTRGEFSIINSNPSSEGKLVCPQQPLRVMGNTNASTWSEPRNAKLSIGSNVVVEGSNGPGIYLAGNGAVLDVYGTVRTSANAGGIQGDGNVNADRNSGGTIANVYEGAVVEGAYGVYWPQSGTLNIKGGTITGDSTGIEMRAGTLNMSGGTVVGNGSEVIVNPNANGGTIEGVGIAVAQHTTKLAMNINITGGEVSGYSALYESNPQNNAPGEIDRVNLALSSGTFKAINGGTVALKSENKTGFITGGTYSSTLDSNYIAEGYYQHVTTGEVLPISDVDPDVDVSVDVPVINPDPTVPSATITEEAKPTAVDIASQVVDEVLQGLVPAGMMQEEANRIKGVIGDNPSHKISAVVSVAVEQKNPADIAADVSRIDGALKGDQRAAVYLDLKVNLIVKNETTGDSATTSLTELNEPLMFEAHVPPDSIANRAVRIAYVHGGNVGWINPDSVNYETGVILFPARVFSTYAVVTSSTVEVAFESNGGSAVPTQTVAFRGKVTKPADPTRSGYAFAGWYADAALTQPWDFDTTVSSYMTLYAKWTAVSGGETHKAPGVLGKTGDSLGGAATLLVLGMAIAAGAVMLSARLAAARRKR